MPGTWVNKRKQLEEYVRFMLAHSRKPQFPETYDVLSYFLFLQDKFVSPSTVRNYMSGARTWVLALTGSAAPFDSYQLSVLKRGLDAALDHTPVQSPPVTPSALMSIIDCLCDCGNHSLVIRSALLMAYLTLLRQSNLLATSDNPQGMKHTLKKAHITHTPHGLHVYVKSSKTIQNPKDRFSILVPRARVTRYCPVETWLKFLAFQPPVLQDELAFLLPDGDPLTPTRLTKIVRLVLADLGSPLATSFTLHGVRRGAAQACAKAGASLEAIKKLGSWRSDTVHTYVPRDLVATAPQALISLFG